MSEANSPPPERDLNFQIISAEAVDGDPVFGFNIMIKFIDSPLGTITLTYKCGAIKFDKLNDRIGRDLKLFGQQLVLASEKLLN